MTPEQPVIADDPAADFAAMDWSLSGHSSPPPDADTVALFWAARNGNFAEHFADYELHSGAAAALGADRHWLLALGKDLGDALIGAKGNYRKGAAGLQKIIRRLVKETGHGKPHQRAACWYLQYVASIQSELERRRDGCSTADRYSEIFGVVIGALEYMRDRGVKPTAPALFAFTKKLALASETDTTTAIKIHTRNVPLESWLRPRASAEG